MQKYFFLLIKLKTKKFLNFIFLTLQGNLVTVFFKMPKKLIKIFFEDEFFFLNKYAREIMKTFAYCKNCKSFIYKYANFFAKIFCTLQHFPRFFK